ncbi:hypothetical protein FDB98_06700 [Clostridium botulinum]|nr:hypothetical protein [Clostridium botulinum]
MYGGEHMNIKFWDIENKIMYENTSSFAIGCNGEVSQLIYHESEENDCVEWEGTEYSKHIKPIFSTGVKDRNGKEIFAGDIVHIENMLISNEEPLDGVVVFHEGAWWVDNEEECRAKSLWGECNYLRVKGNIYENPELVND